MSNELLGLISEDWLKACPTGVLVTDGQRILWANPALERMTGGRARQLMDAGADQQDAALLEKLVSTEGLLGLTGDNGAEAWLFCETASVTAAEQSLKLRFFQDVSGEVTAAKERDRLARKVEELDLTDALTGLANPRALSKALNAQVTRSRRYGNPLSLALVHVEAVGVETPVPDGVILSVSRFLRERFRWVDVIGRYTANNFMLILPETARESADELLTKIRAEADGITAPPPHEAVTIQLSSGVAQWTKGMDAARLVAATEQDLADAMGAVNDSG